MKDMHAAAVGCCRRCGKDSGGLAAVRPAPSSLPARQLHLEAARVSFPPGPSSLQSFAANSQAPGTLNSRAGRRLAALRACIMLRSLTVRA